MSQQYEPSLFDMSDGANSDVASSDVDGELVESTWSVGELHRAIGIILGEAFGGQIWVEGEIRNLKRSANKHVYFDLIDSASSGDQYPPLLSVTLFARERQIVNRFLSDNGGNVRMEDGLRVRIRGSLNTYASRSALQLRMTAIDPTFTLGVLDQMRDRVLASLAADDLLDRNGLLPMPPIPSRVALITSIGSAAHADAMSELMGSGLGLQISVLDARVQGTDAEPSILGALGQAAHLGVDVVLLVRGGGARTDLAAFDLESIARAIATSPVPVITGIGHEIDSSIADVVAHTSHKTPTAACASIVSAVQVSLRRIDSDWSDVVAMARATLNDMDRDLAKTSSGLGLATSRHLSHERQRVDHLWKRLTLSAPRTTTVLNAELDNRLHRVVRSARHLTEMTAGRLDALDARARAHDPRLALAKGWSITRNSSGRLLRGPEDVSPGDTIESWLANGVIQSVVQATAPADSTEN